MGKLFASACGEDAAMETYIAEENVKRFGAMLGETLDPARRRMVIRLLDLAQAKLYDLSELNNRQSDGNRP
jgi:hypothetical protein